MRHSTVQKDMFLIFIGYKNIAPERTFIKSMEKTKDLTYGAPF